MTRRYLGTSDATTPGEHGSNAAVETRTEAQTDPLAEIDCMAYSQALGMSLVKQLVQLNAHLFGVPADQIPLPYLEFREEKSAAEPLQAQPEEAPAASPYEMARAPDPKAAASGEPRPRTNGWARRHSRTRSTSLETKIAKALRKP
jgi:hypothetical protein